MKSVQNPRHAFFQTYFCAKKESLGDVKEEEFDYKYPGHQGRSQFRRNVLRKKMRLLLSLSFVSLGIAVLLILSGCASNRGDLQSRIESKINTPEKGHVYMGPATYNRFSRGFEQPWPFGPYSN